MPDRIFTEQKLAELYDHFNPWGGRSGDDEFYMEHILSSDSVLDVGCGTGLLLRKAREFGHSGRLVGLDPADAMLEIGRNSRSDIEWTYGVLESARFDQEFDLVMMSGHAFQVFISDGEVRGVLAAVRRALTAQGKFVFETRNPSARRWERWTPEHAIEIAHPAGGLARMEHQVDLPIDGDLVSFTTRFTAPTFDGVMESRSTLRFLDESGLNVFLAEAGFEIEAQYGFWDRSPVTETSPEIITVARPASA